MWYNSGDTKKETDKEQAGLDAKLIRVVAENCVKRALYLKGRYNPASNEVDRLVIKAMNEIKSKFGDFNVVRAKTTDEQLTPIINDIISKIV